MQKYLVIDNFLRDPLDIRNKGLKIPVYNKDTHPYTESLGSFPGYRSKYIHEYDKSLYSELSTKIINAIQILTNFSVNTKDYNTHYAYQYTGNNVKPSIHTDTGKEGYEYVFGGIIYLNPNPPRNSGTMLLLDGKREVIDNKFNRLLLYRGDEIEHSLVRSFGRNRFNCRMIISTFTDMGHG
tara:strand:+ start:100 stop:645 length:546 start_codon:yes stop_codon:yes gene_type:complete